MNMKRISMVSVILVTLIAACSSEMMRSTEKTETTDVLAEAAIVVTEVVVTSTVWPILESSICWEQILEYSGDYGPPRSMTIGSDGDLWVIRDNALWRGTINGEGEYFVFDEELGCENCDDLFNGTLEVSRDGEAWLGMTSGVLIVSPDTLSWRMIPREQIIQEVDDGLPVRVLLADQDGYIWVSHGNSLCVNEGISWECENFEDLSTGISFSTSKQVELNPTFISATSGQNSEIWFGDSWGDIVHYKNEEFIVYTNSEMQPYYNIYRIGEMAYDKETETLWIVDNSPPHCFWDELDDSDAVAQRTADGEWSAYEKLLFARAPGEECDSPHTSIAVTPDGLVWLGMLHRHSVAYFDGYAWRTMSGRILPYSTEDFLPPGYDEGKCVAPSYITVDLAVSNDGDLLALTYEGVFRFTGFNYEVEPVSP